MSEPKESAPSTVVVKEKNSKKKDEVSDLEDEDDTWNTKIFPQRLIEILEDESNSHAITWLPHGRAFIVKSRKAFAEEVMPKYFPRKAKYSSFTRKLNRWNFTRVPSGPEMGAYYHEFFLKDKPHLAAQMFCKNARTKLAMATSSAAPAVAANPLQRAAAAASASSATPSPAAAQTTPSLLMESKFKELLLQKQLIEQQRQLFLVQCGILPPVMANRSPLAAPAAQPAAAPNNLLGTSCLANSPFLGAQQAQILQQMMMQFKMRQKPDPKRMKKSNYRASAA